MLNLALGPDFIESCMHSKTNGFSSLSCTGNWGVGACPHPHRREGYRGNHAICTNCAEFSMLTVRKAYDLCLLVKYAYDLNLFSLARNKLVSTVA